MTELNNDFADLINDIARLLTTGYNHDVIVRCGRAPKKIIDFKAHSAILGIRSTYFRTAFSLNYAARKNGVFFLRKENIEPNIFEVIMKYLYTSILDLDALSLSELTKLLVACDELFLSSIIDQIQSYIIDHHSKSLRQDPLKYLSKLNYCSRCTTLKTYIISQLDQAFASLFGSPYFISLNKEMLKELLQNRHEEIEEFEVWNRLMEWSINQANSSPFDPSLLSSLPPDVCSLYSLRYDSRKRKKLTLSEFESWNEQDCELVKHHISGIINLIRWQEIPLKDFDAHISPFQKLLPSSFYAELLAGHTTSPDAKSPSPPDSNHLTSQSSDSHLLATIPSSNFAIPLNFPTRQYFDTTLLMVPHFNIISSWISRKDPDYYTKRLLPYKFNLLYRASKDGFDPKVFHERCDNRGPTVMVTRLYLGGKIIGGYNPLDWKPQEKQEVERDTEMSKIGITTTNALPNNTSKRYSWMTTDDSFLFSFQHLLPTTGIISRVVMSLNQKAVCYDPKSGPGFGAGLDIVVSNRYRTISTWGYSTYPEAQWFLSEQHMEVEDYEVFAVERDDSVELCDEKEEKDGGEEEIKQESENENGGKKIIDETEEEKVFSVMKEEKVMDGIEEEKLVDEVEEKKLMIEEKLIVDEIEEKELIIDEIEEEKLIDEKEEKLMDEKEEKLMDEREEKVTEEEKVIDEEEGDEATDEKEGEEVVGKTEGKEEIDEKEREKEIIEKEDNIRKDADENVMRKEKQGRWGRMRWGSGK